MIALMIQQILLIYWKCHYINEQIMDKREATHTFRKYTDLKVDLAVMEKRRTDLGDAPKLEDHWRFVNRDTISDLLKMNRGYRDHLKAIQSLDLQYQYEIQEIVDKTERLYRLYDALRDSKSEHYYVHYRRYSLKTVRDMVGSRDFYDGKLPPHVPIEHFTRID